jgi:acetyl esterase/lipase
VLLIHGDDDRNVRFSQTVDLAQRLREKQVPFEELVLPDEIHGFLMWRSWIGAYSATADFFDQTLGPAKPSRSSCNTETVSAPISRAAYRIRRRTNSRTAPPGNSGGLEVVADY